MLYILPLVMAIFLAFNMGGSGTAPAFSAAYGAGIIKRSYIPALFGGFVMAGALIAGDKVMATIGGAVLPADYMSLTVVTVILFTSALSIFIANLLKVPQSTSQSTVFSLAGSALAMQVLETEKLLLEIIPVWFVMPIISFFIAFFLGKLFFRANHSSQILKVNLAKHNPIWKYITIACSCYVAFSIGSNNVANSAGPIASMVMANFTEIENGYLVALFTVLIVSPWFGLGSAVLGKGVSKTIGSEITDIGILGATFISVLTATLLLMASLTRGIPTSLVQMNTFAVIALGVVKHGGREILSRISLMKVFTVWLIAPLFALILSYLLTIALLNLGIIK